ncbi:unnamed protein product [Didymodactylos carnosus]|uniref:PARP catalytic domain-containing protein n=1 Tax=Didymodactylos carnosus TaxID=1234261 RepID=A0A815UAK1_9BILA|nr:unnamed protein product [Didymodactylos carnosus]CAF1515045.1 unnamed protein product [Didymodactylos carnosus]CAF4078078.1 unnamed protein product [Didymodactylos carnosus]CAF4375128.1 unnamed protein product [Didymodactylos carnosus]
MCWGFYKTLPIYHGVLAVYELICGLIRLGMFLDSSNSINTTKSLRKNSQVVAAFILDWISSMVPTTMGLFILFLSLWCGCRILRSHSCQDSRRHTNLRLRDLISNKPIQRFLIFNCNCPCYIARPKWRFLSRMIFTLVTIGLRFLVIILYATAHHDGNEKNHDSSQSLAVACGITVPSAILILLLDYYHYRVWWHYVPSCDQEPVCGGRRYLKKHKRFIPYHLMGEHRNAMRLGNEPCPAQYCIDRNLEHIMIFHYNTFRPQARWSEVRQINDNHLGTYVGFHRTSPAAAVSIAYTDFQLSLKRPQMLGFGIYFARSIYHTMGKARREGAVICAEVLMGEVREIENAELPFVSNSDLWWMTYDTIYYRHPTDPNRDEFCIKSNTQILKWVIVIEQPYDTKVTQYGLNTEYDDTQCECI